MKFFSSPLSVLGLMVSLASVILLTIMIWRNFWPTYVYFITFVFGILMILSDYFFIRKNKMVPARKKIFLQSGIALIIIIAFFLLFRSF